MPDGEGSALFSENPAADEDLSFAVFVLAHARCDAPVEIRLGDNLPLVWCPKCAAVQTFGAPGG